MPISITAEFDFTLPEPTDCLLQFEAAAIPEQHIVETDTRISASEFFSRVPSQDAIGERMWIRAHGRFEVAYRATVEVSRMLPDIGGLARMQPHLLPGEAVQYLFDSRYCPGERFGEFVDDEFGGSNGGARIVSICEWINQHFTYAPGSSDAATTALDTFIARRGICRDYAHLLVTLARASAIPARYVSVYAPGVEPPDFHAVAEVFLADPTVEGGGAWHLVDATKMAKRGEIVKIGVGRDAADVSFLTSFGRSQFGDKRVSVTVEDPAPAKVLETSSPD
jgi:transglutaminase-like putative cysteine protease